MLAIPDPARIPHWPEEGEGISSDPSWGLAVNGSATLMSISAVAFHIFQFQVFHSFCCATVGFVVGFLAQKTLGHYNSARSITLAALTFDERVPYWRTTAFSIALIASFIFPILAVVAAVIVGTYSGFLFRPKQKAV
jgi:hypothetical protein